MTEQKITEMSDQALLNLFSFLSKQMGYYEIMCDSPGYRVVNEKFIEVRAEFNARFNGHSEEVKSFFEGSFK